MSFDTADIITKTTTTVIPINAIVLSAAAASAAAIFTTISQDICFLSAPSARRHAELMLEIYTLSFSTGIRLVRNE